MTMASVSMSAFIYYWYHIEPFRSCAGVARGAGGWDGGVGVR